MDTDEKKKASSADEKQSGRRKLLKSVVAGGGAATVAKMVPDQWARPVVDSVMLPSHAQTSNAELGPFVTSGRLGMAAPEVQVAEQGFSEELLEFFTPAAKAGYTISVDSFAMTVNESGSSQLCAIGTIFTNVTTEMISFPVQNGAFTSGDCLLGYAIHSGRFEGDRWDITVTPYNSNSTTTVELYSGGAGCTSGNPGNCHD